MARLASHFQTVTTSILRSPTKLCAAGLVLYTFVCAISYIASVIASGFSLKAEAGLSFLCVVVAGYLFLIAGSIFMRSNRLHLFVSLSWVFIFLFVLLNTNFDLVELLHYGDKGQLAGQLAKGVIFTRWLGGAAILDWLFIGVWQSPFLIDVIPVALKSADAFVKAMGSLTMAAFSVALATTYLKGMRLRVLLPMALPIYWMFASGYDEYYPFVTGIYTLFLVYLLNEPAENLNPVKLGIFAALLTVFYIPFALLCLAVLAVFMILFPKKGVTAATCSVIAFIVFLNLFWPAGVDSYFRNLYGAMNLGDAATGIYRYLGNVANQHSIFFSWRYALSPEHLGDLAYMFFWSGSAITIIITGLCLLYHSLFYFDRQKIIRPTSSRNLLREIDKRVWLGLAILVQQIHYFIFMIPKLGPRQDVDLFFSVFVSMVCLLGAALDRLLRQNHDRSSWVYLVLCAVVGNAVIAGFFLLDVGIPAVY